MKKVFAILFFVLIVLPALILGGCSFVICRQYQDTFMPGQFINSVYVADYTPEEVNEKLIVATDLPDFLIVDKNKKEYSFSLSEINYQVDYSSALEKMQQEQTVLSFVKWFMNTDASKGRAITLEPVFSYDEEALTSYLKKQSYLKDDSSMKGKKIEVCYDAYKGYYLVDNTQNMLDQKACIEAIRAALDEQIYKVDLEKKNCYVKPTLTKEMKEAKALWNELESFMRAEITYAFGKQQYVISSYQTAKLLAVDEEGELLRNENGHFFLDEKLVKEFVKEMADKYNTVNKPRTFRATRGEIITIPTGTYGSIIDEKAEVEYLLSALKYGRNETHYPQYRQIPYSGITDIDDIGDTYIEVDMTNQHLYYYENGRICLETPVVTGNTGLGRGTPVKVCYVYMKQRNRTLRGEGYASFVKYWMPVFRGVGIHDSSWRGKYGGTIYKTAGSHGCINTPIEIVSQLYDRVEVGTPVLLFY